MLTVGGCHFMIAAALCLLAVCRALPLQAQTRDRARVAAAVDSLAAEALKGGHTAGLTVAVVRGSDTLVFKGYGKADLELDVPTPDRAVYQLGSVTKQFTAAAILQLQEQGKLSLDDEITKFLPNYPVHGHRVTIRRLLDHTSGIAGYTEMPEIKSIRVQVLPRDSLIAIFAPKPFLFAPGAAESYNNSAYFLLGFIIEKASGMSYEEYVQQNLFARAGMTDSRYCSNSAVVPRRAHGYNFDAEQLKLATYVNFRWPYSGGALCSTAGDLVAWNRVLHGGKLLGPAAYREMITPDTLNDGTRLRYAKGLMVDSMLGHRSIHHGGAIDGFQAELACFPDDTLTVVVLVNTLGSVDPGLLAQLITAFVLGDRSPTPIAFRGRTGDYVGAYRGAFQGQEMVFKVTADSANGLVLAFADFPARRLAYMGGEAFRDRGFRFTFVREAGRVTKLRADLVVGYTVAIRNQAAGERAVSR